MSGELPPSVPPRIVIPRKFSAEDRPVIAVTRDLIVAEFLGDEVFPVSNLGPLLKTAPSSIIAVQGFGERLQRLQRSYGEEPEFNYRVTPIHRYSRPWDDGRRMVQGMVQDTVCNFVGWRYQTGVTRSGNPKFETRYHYPLDPLWFLTSGIDELDESADVRIVKLYRWAREVRDWCKENGLKVKASAGGIAAQLLRDSRFYPEPRRKAPRSVNVITRYRLPGNYYHLRATPGRRYRATYLDMTNAHHTVARSIRFPDVNTLHAFGDMAWSAHEDKRRPVPFANGDSKLLEQPGLFHLSLDVPIIAREKFPPPYMETQGLRDVWVYSDELPMIRELGGGVRHIYGAFTSRGFDEGLNRYAKFAIEQIRKHPESRYWLKPTLHCTYGLLAARPVSFETGYYRAKSGEHVAYPMGNVSVRAIAKIRSAEIESRIVNVIHRGMIEAAVRAESLRMARLLTEYRHEVLAIYADGIFVRHSERDLPLLDPPWRIKEDNVTNLRFQSATTFTSHQISRLPGIPRTAKDRYIAQREIVRELRAAKDGKARTKRDMAVR